jgi:hypothetical protein
MAPAPRHDIRESTAESTRANARSSRSPEKPDFVRSQLRGLTYQQGRTLVSPQPRKGARDHDSPPVPESLEPSPGTALEPVAEGSPEHAPEPVPERDTEPETAPQPQPEPPTGVAAIPPDKRRMIRQGSRGKEVTYAQERLNAHGTQPPLTPDGIFGPLTRKAALEYQNSHALAADAIIGPRSWASLDGPVQVGTSGGRGTNVAGGGGPGSIMLYDNSDYSFPPPPPGTKKDVPLKDIDAAQKDTPPRLGSTIKVENPSLGPDAEVHLYWVIARLGRRDRWGSEVDLVTQIGWAPKGSTSPAPVGKVQLRIDGSGNATASMLAAGAATVADTFKTKPDAVIGLKTTFGFVDVVDGTASWTVSELNKVHGALSRLSAGERSALRGVVLKRMQTLMDDGKPAAGIFATHHELSADAKTATSTATLSLANEAFSHDLRNFIGGSANAAPISFQTILHEVGHAVDEGERYKARKTEFEATAEFNRKNEVFEEKRIAANDSLTELNKAVQAMAPVVNGYKGKVAQEASKYVRAADAIAPKIGDLARARTGAEATTAEATAKRLIDARNRERDALKKAAPSNPALTDLSDLEDRQNEAFTAGQERAAALREKETAGSAQARAKAATEATQTADGKEKVSKRLKKFKSFIAQERIPPLTKYAETGTDEFYAEAFSLFHADPEYLKLVAVKLFNWFDRGEHVR